MYEEPLSKHSYHEVEILMLGNPWNIVSVHSERYNAYFIAKVTKDKETFQRNFEVFTSVVHLGMAQCYDSFTEDGTMFLILENCPNGSLKSLVKRRPLTEQYVKQYACDIMSTVMFLHLNNYCFFDMKPESIWIDGNERLKLTNFSCCVDMNGDLSANKYMPHAFSAPETRTPHYDVRLVDSWNCGIILYFMCFGNFPWDPEKRPQFSGSWKVQLPRNVCPEIETAINGALEVSPLKRMPIANIFKLLSSESSHLPRLFQSSVRCPRVDLTNIKMSASSLKIPILYSSSIARTSPIFEVPETPSISPK